jgi:hypothetical protein
MHIAAPSFFFMLTGIMTLRRLFAVFVIFLSPFGILFIQRVFAPAGAVLCRVDVNLRVLRL